ncbi:class I SAM-dependent methyltransferase [Streptomyces sp. NPDC006692]|uniref:class I SAM-dependent methyltransferase n=1 Tax=unclassified Streptomyces TaxID=2593676 RepID=UPI0036CD29F7
MRDIANTEQAQAWNGYEGTYWADHQDRWDAVNAGFDQPLLDAAAIGPHDRVLDIGCGAGQSTLLAARAAGHGQVLGVDLSQPMLARARARAAEEGIGNAEFEQADVQVHPFEPGAVDVAISRFGVMFFADPVATFTNVAAALRPGGRLAFICAAEPARNEWVAAMAVLREHLPIGDFGAPGLPGMFSLADPDRVRGVLGAAGFSEVAARPVEAYGIWGHTAQDAADFLLNSGPGRHITAQVSEKSAARAREALTERLRAHERDGSVRLRSTAWLVTAERPA